MVQSGEVVDASAPAFSMSIGTTARRSHFTVCSRMPRKR